MRFLADESCDFAVVRALRDEGYDVQSIIEACPGAEEDRKCERCFYACDRVKGYNEPKWSVERRLCDDC